MPEYPKLLINQSMTLEEGKKIAGFYIKRLLSPEIFRTAYYDVLCTDGRLSIIKDDKKAAKLSGYNYHENAEIRHSVLKGDIKVDDDKFVPIIKNNSTEWANFLMDYSEKDSLKKTADFVSGLDV